MTSNNIPALSAELVAKLNNGVYEITPPDIINYPMPLGDRVVPALKLKCRSLFVYRPDTLQCCNSVVTTIIGEGSGDQTELIECGKCRTSYLVRKHYKEDGSLEIRATVWEIGRGCQKFCELKRDSDYHCWVEFNKKPS